MVACGDKNEDQAAGAPPVALPSSGLVVGGIAPIQIDSQNPVFKQQLDQACQLLKTSKSYRQNLSSSFEFGYNLIIKDCNGVQSTFQGSNAIFGDFYYNDRNHPRPLPRHPRNHSIYPTENRSEDRFYNNRGSNPYEDNDYIYIDDYTIPTNLQTVEVLSVNSWPMDQFCDARYDYDYRYASTAHEPRETNNPYHSDARRFQPNYGDTRIIIDPPGPGNIQNIVVLTVQAQTNMSPSIITQKETFTFSLNRGNHLQYQIVGYLKESYCPNSKISFDLYKFYP